MRKKKICIFMAVAVILTVGSFFLYSIHHRSSGKRLDAESAKTFYETYQDALEALPGQLRGAYQRFDLERKGGRLVCSWQTADGTVETNVSLMKADLPADAIDCLQALMKLPAIYIDYQAQTEDANEQLTVLTYSSYDKPMGSLCAAVTRAGLSYAPNEHQHRQAALLGGSWYLYEDFMP